MQSISEWLQSLGLDQYAQVFVDNFIDLEVIPSLSEADLEKLGVPMGHRKKLLKAVAELSTTDTTYSLSSPATDQHTSTDVGERRYATVLFSDLSGYTAMNERLDPEEVRTLMARIKAQAVRIVEAHGGSVNQFVGDEVLALFGIPTAHKDDPVRAVRAALEMHEMVRVISPDVEEVLGRSIRLHSGIATGLVVTHRADDRDGRVGITGDTVNVGARLKSIAAEDSIIVCANTQRAVRSAFELEVEAVATLKGKRNGVTPYRVVGAQTGSHVDTTPFVGRRTELRQIQGAMDVCLEAEAGQVIVIRGEPGIGKTRLSKEALNIATERGFECHSVAILDFGGDSRRDPLRVLVSSILGIDPDAREGERQNVARQCLDDGGVEAHLEIFLLDLLDVSLTDQMRAKYDAMDNAFRNRQRQGTAASLLRAAAKDRPCFVLVEDVHWADNVSLAQLAALAAMTSECPALLVLTTRTNEDPLNSTWRQSTGGGALSTIDLNPLQIDDAWTMAHSYRDVTEKNAERCIQRAAGNPLFLEQLLLSADQVDTTAVPGTVQSLVLARIDQLPSRDKTLLQAASVLGQRFDPKVVGRLVGVPVLDLKTLSSQGLLRQDEAGYMFTHALVRDGVYESLLLATRRDYHARAADWFSQRDAILYAEHLEAAGDTAAAQAFLVAARTEANALHLDRALRLVERGAALAKQPANLCELLLEKGRLQRELGALKVSISSYEQAVSIAQDDSDRCLGLVGMAEGMRLSDDFERCLSVLAEAQPLGESLSRPDLQAQIHYLRGCIFFGTGRINECLDAHLRAKQSASDSGSIDTELRALGGLADGYYAVGRIRDGYRILCECVDKSNRSGLHRIEAANRVAKAWSQQYIESAASSLEEMKIGLSQSQEVGLWRSTLLARNMIAGLLMVTSRLDEASSMLSDSLDELENLEAPRMVAIVYIYQGYLEHYRGDRQSALSYSNRARQIFETTGGAHFTAGNYGLIAMSSPRYEDSLMALSLGEEALQKGAAVHNHYDFRRHSIETALQFEQWDDAIAFADKFEQYNQQERTPWADFFVRRGRLLAAVGKGLRTKDLLQEASNTIALGEQMGLLIALPELRAASELLAKGGTDYETV